MVTLSYDRFEDKTKWVENIIDCAVYGMNMPIIKSEMIDMSSKDEPEDDPDTPVEPDTPVTPDQPEKVNTTCYIGAISMIDSGIGSYTEILPSHIESLQTVDASQNKYYSVNADKCSIIVVAVPKQMKAKMLNGIGEYSEFYINANDNNGNPFYCNGEITSIINEEEYKLYGIFTIASGVVKIMIQ